MITRHQQFQIQLLTMLTLAVFILFIPQISFAANIPLGFTSQEQHSDSLLDYGARYYDADAGKNTEPITLQLTQLIELIVDKADVIC